jgi:hypothetical protein
VDGRKQELIDKVRASRARLHGTMASLDDRIAVIGDMKDKAIRIGRITAIAVGVTTVTIAVVLLLRALTGPPARRRARR